MTLNELIEILQKLQDEGKGDYEILVAYRDEGGVYPGCEDVDEPYVKDNKKQIIL